MTTSATCRLPPDRDAPAGARRAVERLAATLSAELCCDTRLVVSELVTALVPADGRGQIAVELEARDDDHVVGRIWAPEGPTAPATESLRRRILDLVATGWGVDRDARCAWFEIRRPRRPALRLV
jgi:hypothetical protein